MKKILRVFSLFFVLVLSFIHTACSPSGSAIDLYAFNTAIHIETHDKEIEKSTIEKLNSEINRLDSEFDAHSESSYVYKVNNGETQTLIPVFSDVIKLVKLAKEYYEFSEGKFNFALYPLIDAWQFYDYPKLNFAPPSEQTINQIIESGALSPNNILLNESEQTISKTNEQTKIDLGGIAKGYVVDVIANLLKEDGHALGYVNVGGSSLYLLSVDSLTIKHPRATEKKPTVIEIFGQDVQNTAVSTSGDYQRFYEYQDKIYSHVIDGQTGIPTTTNIVSATLLGGTASFGDAMTTALCCFEYYPANHDSSPLIKFAKKIIDSNHDCLLFLIYDDGQYKIILTNANDSQYKLLDNSYQIKSI